MRARWIKLGFVTGMVLGGMVLPSCAQETASMAEGATVGGIPFTVVMDGAVKGVYGVMGVFSIANLAMIIYFFFFL
jgi:hypothetical protein